MRAPFFFSLQLNSLYVNISSMNIDNDELLNELLDDEYKRIPFPFRINKRISVAALAVMGVFIVAAAILIFLFYDSGKYERLPVGNGPCSLGVNIYNNSYLVYAIVCLVIVEIIAGWLFLAQLCEKRAFAKASKLAGRLHFAEMHRREVRRQEEKMLFRPKDPADFGGDF